MKVTKNLRLFSFSILGLICFETHLVLYGKFKLKLTDIESGEGVEERGKLLEVGKLVFCRIGHFWRNFSSPNDHKREGR